MFDDPSAQSLLFHAGTKFAVLVVLVLLWVAWLRRGLLPYVGAMKAAKAGGGKSGKGFPLTGLVGCVVLSVVFVYYATFEVGFREVNRIDNKLIDQRDATLKASDEAAGDIVVPEDGEMTLEQMAQDRMERAGQENAAERERFEELESVED